MSARQQDIYKLVEYPDSDGEPVAETQKHAELMMDLCFMLQRRYQAAPDVFVGLDNLMYWVKGDPTKSKAPDVYAVFGVSKEPPRRTWQTWVEGKAPDVIFEISSRKTWRDDLYDKWQLYARLGVREYFIFDPEYDYLPEPLMAWRLSDDGQYFPIPLIEGCVQSDVLGLELCDTGATLRLHDLQTGELLLTALEESAAREAAEVRTAAAEVRTAQAEARAERLAAQLRALGLTPDAG